ncbi:MAG: DUF4167 domain-containing protein [Rickettsiales bacterium]|jgi:hypothetical protein
MNYVRKKPSSQGSGGYNNNSGGQRSSNKPRFSHSGGGGQGHNNNSRTRKNYGAMREKYLAQARDALASGDRVLAENYFQHADHCFRMIAEENASRPPRVQNNQQATQVAETAESNSESRSDEDDTISTNVSSLPAFLTAGYEAPKKDGDSEDDSNSEEE